MYIRAADPLRHDEDSVAPLTTSARFAWRFPGLQRGRSATTLSREEIIADKLASKLPAAPARPLHSQPRCHRRDGGVRLPLMTVKMKAREPDFIVHRAERQVRFFCRC